MNVWGTAYRHVSSFCAVRGTPAGAQVILPLHLFPSGPRMTGLEDDLASFGPSEVFLHLATVLLNVGSEAI